MRWLGPAAALLGIGWYFAFCILIGLLGGRWLDGAFQTSPLFTLIGVALGLAVALLGGFRMLMRVLNFGQSDGGSEET
jgi:F0F1-type ATP synthase assembly protein I